MKTNYLGPIKIDNKKMHKMAMLLYYMVLFVILALGLAEAYLFVFPIKENNFISTFWSYVSGSKYFWNPFYYFNILREPDYLIKGGAFKIPLSNISYYEIIVPSFITILVVLYKYKRNLLEFRNKLLPYVLLFVSLLSFVYVINRYPQEVWIKNSSETVRSYLEIQLWAKENTKIDSLFLPDPSQGFGWRDSSERSSFGSIREWGLSSIVYNPVFKVYNEGINRMNKFGINIENVTDDDIKKTNLYRTVGDILVGDIRNNYYGISEDNLYNICKENRIDYCIRDKNQVKKQFSNRYFEKAFENKHFILYRVKQL